jgi:hypothetical protein
MPDPEPRSRFKTPAIVLAISAALVILSIGLCSAGRWQFDGPSSPVGDAGFYCFFAGLFGGVVSVLWLLIALVSNSFRNE